MTAMQGEPRAVFLLGWCGHGDEAEHLRTALPAQLLTPSWMPAPGSIDLAASGQAVVDGGFAGSLLIGHSMGGAMACLLAADPVIAARGLVLLDSSVPMPPERRSDNLERMGQWWRPPQPSAAMCSGRSMGPWRGCAARS